MVEPSSPPAGSEPAKPTTDDAQAEVSAAEMSAPTSEDSTPDLTEEELAIMARRMGADGKPTPVKGGVAGAILAAALKGVGIALEPENHETVGIEQAGDKLDKDDDPLANVSFGDLPPLS